MNIIDGKLVSSFYKNDLRSRISSSGLKITLAVILVGDNPASKIYVSMKTKECNEVGIYTKDFFLPSDTTEDVVIKIIRELNRDDEIDGILVQLPLPKHIDEYKVLSSISPLKDVDGFHPENVGKLLIGKPFVEPCTPKGIIRLMDYYNIPIEGKRAVVIGRSNIVGKPVSVMLMHRNATVTVCHSKTVGLEEISKQADILIVAVGKPRFVNSSMVREGSVVIDVGINKIEIDGRSSIVGDVDFDNVKDLCSYITPVPGGVGPMTRAMLLENTYNLAVYRRTCGCSV
ncbi:MAG: bifunctional methylenetetrahydrofolate dehydrogenase/methenyltetrahydrofolate cyclohydrolase FolD [Spirochaetia bacterium]|nr:bifunctional methylenetetrahydrofolate dehydrogenase/methenyltetrahydrofolate cyclohydrolase FolD [Spirochaetota bacterium]MCX8096800.1 bifunctional methylenetetrahydrofolate dehydrogenase/methenyltetrahydrofolate cyclohydrolase FolD [Spirochaetota bacterium]MDW8112611.1 bifunctional methylenetetrahydrofolate dehydrogenase/methenyltetrahydrofolate cyclohydrolase FolD [Spirochaetia bacterium]